MTLNSVRKHVKSILFAAMALASSTTLYQTGCGTNLGYGGYYDVGAIQSVIDYRTDVMDWSNDAWDAYIRE